MIIVMIEHILFAIKMGMTSLIKDEPYWINNLKHFEALELEKIQEKI